MNVDGKVAIVTGGGRGVGRATAQLLAREGAQVVINDLDLAAAEETRGAIMDEGGIAATCTGDVTAPEFADSLIETTVNTFGTIDIIVNNAGYIWNGAMHNHSDEQWHAMLDVHVTAPFRILRAFANWFRPVVKAEIAAEGAARCRKVVNVSSVSGTQGAATQVAYASGKAAVTGMTRTLAKEWGRFNITVNCVAFGHIDTRLTQVYSDDPPSIEVGGRDFRVGLHEDMVGEVQRASALGRVGQPEDGAGAIYLLCLPASDYITGQVLTCSGSV